MKLITALFFVLATTSVFANNVKITSFVRAGNSDNLAELCGLVEGTFTAPSYVKVTVDPGSRRPGAYNTVAGLDGKFCLVVLTYYGRAEASHVGDKKVSVANLK
jgi:hypothetical protein